MFTAGAPTSVPTPRVDASAWRDNKEADLKGRGCLRKNWQVSAAAKGLLQVIAELSRERPELDAQGLWREAALALDESGWGAAQGEEIQRAYWWYGPSGLDLGKAIAQRSQQRPDMSAQDLWREIGRARNFAEGDAGDVGAQGAELLQLPRLVIPVPLTEGTPPVRTNFPDNAPAGPGDGWLELGGAETTGAASAPAEEDADEDRDAGDVRVGAGGVAAPSGRSLGLQALAQDLYGDAADPGPVEDADGEAVAELRAERILEGPAGESAPQSPKQRLESWIKLRLPRRAPVAEQGQAAAGSALRKTVAVGFLVAGIGALASLTFGEHPPSQAPLDSPKPPQPAATAAAVVPDAAPAQPSRPDNPSGQVFDLLEAAADAGAAETAPQVMPEPPPAAPEPSAQPDGPAAPPPANPGHGAADGTRSDRSTEQPAPATGARQADPEQLAEIGALRDELASMRRQVSELGALKQELAAVKKRIPEAGSAPEARTGVEEPRRPAAPMSDRPRPRRAAAVGAEGAAELGRIRKHAGRTYVEVMEGETLTEIAQRAGVTVDQLRRFNPAMAAVADGMLLGQGSLWVSPPVAAAAAN